MQIIPAKTSGFIKIAFPNFIWNIDTTDKVLYLTFDDGPTPNITAWVLKTLKAYNAKASFFCIGNNIEKYPEIFKQIVLEGHAIGNHTYTHLKGWKHKTKVYVEEVQKTQEIIKAISSNIELSNDAQHIVSLNKRKANAYLETSKLFRPPYGKLKSKQRKQLQQLGYKIIMWDVLSFDWSASTSKETCLKNCTSKAKEGSIIVFHDSVKASENLKYTLPKVLKYFSNKGYVFKALNFGNS